MDEDPPPADPAALVSTITIKPETLNLNSNGVFTIFIELEFVSGYTLEDIDPISLGCFNATALRHTIASGKKLIVKLDREDLAGVPVGDEVLFTVTGKFHDGTPFLGQDTIRVIDK